MHISYKNKPCSQTNRTTSDHGLTVPTCICIIYTIGLTCLLNPCLSSITKVLYTVHGRPIIEVNIAPIKENTAECVICQQIHIWHIHDRAVSIVPINLHKQMNGFSDWATSTKLLATLR